nr:non-ribosomal peptide synthetase [Legionella tunisiensis]
MLRALLSYLGENKQRLRQFRLLLCGSDLWTMGEYRQARALFGQGTRVINSYGLTEATIDSTYFEETTATTDEFSKPDTELVPIGKPFPHVHIYVLNESLQLLPPLEMGEIYIGGEGVAAGYLGQEKMTNERFIVHPEMKERLYKTGDFGKVLTNGTIEFFGRNQTHIKINGQRVELLTLDSILNQHPKIQYSIAYPIFSSSNDTSLGCFVLPSDDSVSFDELVLYIKEHLPVYYVPKTIDVIKELVLNQNGKIDRAITSQKIVKSLKPFVVPPKTVLEKQLAGIWQKWLNLDEIGITHHFCDLGGSSLAFVSMLEEVNRTFNTKISYCNASPTIEDLTKLISLSEDVNAKRLMANNECKSLEGEDR